MKLLITVVAALFACSAFAQTPQAAPVVKAEKKLEQKKIEANAAENVKDKAENAVDARADLKHAKKASRKAKKEAVKSNKEVKQAEKDAKKAAEAPKPVN